MYVRISRTSEVDKFADVYSFAITMYEVVTRLRPWVDEDGARLHSNAIRRRVLAGERPKVPEGCDASLADVMQRCWTHEPTDRPTFSDVVVILTKIKDKV